MDLSVIIVSWNVRTLLKDCLDSVYQSISISKKNNHPFETQLWVVDNASSDKTVEMVKQKFPDVNLIANNLNLGFARANNQGIQEALCNKPRNLLLLNPDTIIHGRALELLSGFLDEHDQVGMAGARLIYKDGSFQHGAFRFPGLAQLLIDLFPVPVRLHDTRFNGRYPRAWYQPQADPFPIDHPLGAAMMVRRQVIDSVGVLDTDFFMYCEEIDWAMRIRQAGWDIYCVPSAEIVHLGGQSTSQIQLESLINLWKSRRQLYIRHYSPSTVRLASLIVRLGMRRLARRTESDSLKTAYRQVESLWT